MQALVCLLTIVPFAVHAVVGCGAHRTCEHRTAILVGQCEAHADHHCDAHHGAHDEAPCEDGQEPSEPCSHSVCSYVKAEAQQVDTSNAATACWAALGPVCVEQGRPTTVADHGPICRADLSSTHLYVWHCALII